MTVNPLTAADVDAYRSDGFVLVREMFTADEAASLRDAGHAIIKRLGERHDVEATWEVAGAKPEAAPTSLHHCHDVQFHSALFSRYLTDPRLAHAAATLMGTPNVQLHHNKLFIKPPAHGSPFPLHQDWPFFPHEHDSLVAVIIHLDEASEEKGCLRVLPGSHQKGRLDHVGKKQWHLPVDEYPVASARPLPAKAGDVLFFSCLTVHGSGPNTSGDARTTWLVQLRDAADTPTVDRHRSPGQGTMLSGDNVSHAPPPSVL